MRVNADFSQSVVITPDQHQWVASPQPGVERILLDRIGAEQARATSIVRYAPDSRFPAHAHPGGEEILVLSGTFSDDSGDYPTGWYLRNPPGSRHTPASAPGAVIFVKLRQMPDSEAETVRIDTRDSARWCVRAGRRVCPLFSRPTEEVLLMRLTAGETLQDLSAGGAEILVVDGGVLHQGRNCAQRSWLRLPPGQAADLVGGDGGATLYLKTGHLRDPALTRTDERSRS